MRVSDIMLSNGFVSDIAKTKQRIDKLGAQLSNSTRVQKPSDDPKSASRIIRLGNQISQNDSYAKNVSNSQAFVNETTYALETIQTEVSNILTKMTELNNASNEGNYKTYAEQIDLTLKSIMDSANSQSDGKYIFGGTDHSTMPYGYTGDGASVETKASVSGNHSVKLSSNILQKINMTGTEIFGTVLKGTGNLNATAVVGTVSTVTATVYDANKEEYELTMNFTKTAANTYSLSYDIADSTNTSIYSTLPASVEIKYDPETGDLKTIDGKETTFLKIQDSDHHLDFSLNLNFVDETDSATSLSFSANQKTDIFNTLLRVRNDLTNGVKPSAEDEQMIKDFNKSMLDKITETGNISNKLADTGELLTNQKSVLDGLLTDEQEIDAAKAILDLQNQQYMLEMAYKVSSTILPKSLLDYL